MSHERAAWDEGVRDFLAYWFAGLVEGLEEVDEAARASILAACGRACARSYTAQVFREAWAQSEDLDAFLIALAARFQAASYERVGPQAIRVSYARCACDLVTLGLVTSAVICGCSARNLQANFEGALEAPVTVTPVASILGGDDHCVFLVSLGEKERKKNDHQGPQGG